MVGVGQGGKELARRSDPSQQLLGRRNHRVVGVVEHIRRWIG